jgi:hypothetical protein
LFQCDCGSKKKLAASRVKKGAVKSCGCLDREQTVRRNKAMATHGKTGTPTFKSWEGMRQRCNNPKNADYKNYGGRGVSVCSRWYSFENFLKDMGVRPKGKTLDRIDLHGNYEPNNCRWATPYEQANNQRTNIKHNGKTVAQWCVLTGVKPGTAYARIRRGWAVSDAVRSGSV